MTPMQTTKSTWETYKPVAIALAVGLVVGPFISNYIGWQVTSGTARAQARDGIVEQLALICEKRARADVADPAKLEWAARNDLAKKWVVAPGAPFANLDVTYDCARKLAI